MNEKVVCFYPQCLLKSTGRKWQWKLEVTKLTRNLGWKGFKQLLILPESLHPLLVDNMTWHIFRPLDPKIY